MKLLKVRISPMMAGILAGVVGVVLGILLAAAEGQTLPTQAAPATGPVEVKTPRTGLRPTRMQHGTPLILRNEFVHGIADQDALQIKVTVEGNDCFWWSNVVLKDVELGSVWRTAHGAAQGLHVDRLQLLGNDRQTAPTNVFLENVRFTTRGDRMPAEAGATTADNCLLQELKLGIASFRRVYIEPGLSPIKLTFRTAASRCEGVWIEDSPGLRVHVTAMNAAQVGPIVIRNSPGADVTGANGLPLTIVREDTPSPSPATMPATQPATAPAAVSFSSSLPGIDVRLAPFSAPTSDVVRKLIAQGKYRPLNYCGNGEFNVTLGWADKYWGVPFATLDDATPITPALGNPNQCNPPTRRAVTALSLLSKSPGHFGQFPREWGAVPIVFNLEYDRTSGLPDVITHHEGDLARRRNAILTHIDALQWCREVVGPDHEVLWFGNPGGGWGEEPEILELEKRAASQLSAVGAMMYLWDENAVEYVRDGAVSFFTTLRKVEARFDRVYGAGKRKHVFLHPCWQIYWPQNLHQYGLTDEQRKRIEAMNNQPIPMPLWRQMIDCLRAGGCEYSIWLGGANPSKVMEQLEYAGGARK